MSGVGEQGYRRGEAVQEVLPADRADLPPDQELPALQLGLVFVDRATHMKAPTNQLEVLGRERYHDLLQSLEGRPTSQLMDDVPLRPRYGVDVADRAASLGDESPDPD